MLELFDDSDNLEDEILYGNAGYLYCLLLLRKHVEEDFYEDIDEAIVRVV